MLLPSEINTVEELLAVEETSNQLFLSNFTFLGFKKTIKDIDSSSAQTKENKKNDYVSGKTEPPRADRHSTLSAYFNNLYLLEMASKNFSMD